MNSTRVLVAGANGFLGRYLCRECLKRNYHVDGLVHESRIYIPSGVNIISLNSLREGPSSEYDVIFIVAGNYRDTDNKLTEANVELPRQLVALFPKSKIVFVSSVSVYGVHTGTIHLESPFIKPDNYGRVKLEGESVVQKALSYSIVRLSNLYGFGMNTSLLIPTMITAASSRTPITLYGDGGRFSDYLYIYDAVDVCLRAASVQKNGAYIGASGVSVTNSDLAKIISDRFGGVQIVYKGADASVSARYDISATVQQLGFIPGFSVKEGMNDLISKYEV